jgi:Flp pilus assembly pilin Flp
MLKQFLTKFLTEECGQDVVEYSLLLTLLGAVSVTMLTMSGINVGQLFDKTLNHAETTVDRPVGD